MRLNSLAIVVLILAAGLAPAQEMARVDIPINNPSHGITNATVSAAKGEDSLNVSLPVLSPIPSLEPTKVSLPTPEIRLDAETEASARQSLQATAPKTAPEQVPEAGPGRMVATAPQADAGIDPEFAARKLSEHAAPHADLPPAGPLRSIDIKTLMSLPIDWENNGADDYKNLDGILSDDPVMRADAFSTIKKSPETLTPILDAMHRSLVGVLKSSLPPRERWPIAVSLERRYADWLTALRQEPGMPEEVARSVDQKLNDLLTEDNFVFEFARRFMIDHQVLKLKNEGPAAPDTTASPALSKPPWEISMKFPFQDRKSQDKKIAISFNLSAMLKSAKELREEKERLENRLSLAQTRGFSPSLVNALTRQLDDLMLKNKPLVDMIAQRASRITDMFFRRQFVFKRLDGWSLENSHGPINKQHLQLISVAGGFIIQASFESDIQKIEVLETFKSSIEEYWRGIFELDGKTIGLRTNISIRKLKPGEDFSPDALKLTETEGLTAYVNGEGIHLSRKLDYHTPAHEFGHVLGLPDEYTEVYQGPDQGDVHVQNEGSLMSSWSGVLHPRHFRAAYESLKSP